MFNFLKKKSIVSVVNAPSSKEREIDYPPVGSFPQNFTEIYAANFQKPLPSPSLAGYAMDDLNGGNIVPPPGVGNFRFVGEDAFQYFCGFGFIGYSMCALLSQHWLINLACLTPAKDAIRKGFEIAKNDSEEIPSEVYADIEKLDKKFKLKRNLTEFVYFGRVFGIRVALFEIDSTDPDYYEKPFNLDGIRPNSYKGISQIDPYWIAPQLSAQAASNPASIDFYEPTWWMINGKRYHKSHLVIFITEEVADVLKPTYFYGGVPITQKIMRRVFAAERTANEAPHLALSKRTSIIKTDLAKALANQVKFQERLEFFTTMRDNFGVKVIDTEDEYQQFDTSLSEVSDVTMMEFQLVAAASDVPVTKLLKTVPKGFNATGEYDESNYHESLESIQSNDFSPMIERHHQLVIRSEICPKYNIPPFEISHVWKALDSMTAEERAKVQELKAKTGKFLVESGAIDGEDERTRITADPDSGYNGLAMDREIELNEDAEEEKGYDS
jgi:uncharacterized protein